MSPSAERERPGEDLRGPRRPPGPTCREAVRGVRAELDAAGVEGPGVEAERLVAAAMGLERADLALDPGRRMSAAEAGRLAGAVRRRLSGEPLQHIEGTVEFRELVLTADPRALIPRPETEQLVERILRWARRRGSDGPPLDAALDIGTGSGAIALSLVVEGICRRAVGVDVSARALEQAAENRSRAGVAAERVELRLAARPVWTAISPGERFDLIVSNPPYVTDAEWEELPSEVRAEPRVALAGGREGLDLVREIAARGARYLRPGGALFLEIGSGQGAAVRDLLAAAGDWGRVRVERDLAGRERFVRAVPTIR